MAGQGGWTIGRFMGVSAVAGALAVFVVSLAIVDRVYDRTVREDAREVSTLLADQTFAAMFQVMRKGWSRAEVEEFLHAMRQRFADTPYALEVYRGPKVVERFGRIEQPEADPAIRAAFANGRKRVLEQEGRMRQLYPLTARQECLRCHRNAQAGDVLGVIDLRLDLGPVLARARSNFMATLWLLVPFMLGGALVVAGLIQHRIRSSVLRLRARVGAVNKVSDLADLSLDTTSAGFRELDEILGEVKTLAKRTRTFAVDKELLEFEIRLLERFVITSDVVRDWKDYVANLLVEINQVMESYLLFSVFKVEEEQFDLEVFWRNEPSPHMAQVLERNARALLQRHPYFKGAVAVRISHNIADPGTHLPQLSEQDIRLRSKSLFVDSPRIGGIVGIGVQAGTARDPMRDLVTESILSTLLNVVGSVKAIYKYTKELEHYATRDPLTNLFNQRVFWELLEYELGRAERKEEKLGLMVIDLDNFKRINDRFGHGFGDRYLQAFAELLRKVFRLGDIVARYGGDEFVALLTDTPPNQLHAAALRLAEEARGLAMDAADGTGVRATISIGIALYPDHGTAPRDLFLVADNMMYRAKREGRNRVLLAGEEDMADIYRHMGEQSFAILAALEERRFVPYFQPIVSAEDGRVHAYEMLCRLQNDDGEVVPAAQFIEAAEHMGVVQQVDYLVLEQAFAHLAGQDALLFVNLSPKALILSEFIPTVVGLAKGHGIDPQRVVLELTERETVRNIALLQRFVNALKMEGFNFAIDDFGSGFSSFHYLKHFPIDYVKIDGDFIVNLTHDERDQVFVRHMAAMARDLRIRTVAEFVEDDEILQAVRAAGIDYAQGFEIGRPAPQAK